MGLYVNPEGDKLAFLTQANATRVHISKVLRFDYDSDVLPCAYIDNGAFDAIAIGYSEREVKRFFHGRPDATWYLVPKAALKPWLQ